jgi:c-di-AMP phosphodiesterase-like protein
MIAIILIENPVIGIVSMVLFVLLFIHNYKENKQKLKKWSNYIETLGDEIDSASRNAFINIPMPLTLIDIEGKIIWFNSKFSELFYAKEILDENLTKIVPGIELEKLFTDDLSKITIKVSDRYFNIVKNFVKVDSSGEEGRYIIILYWIDITKLIKLQGTYDEEKTVVALIQIDNYEDVLSSAKEEKVPFVISEIESRVNSWALRNNGMVKKYQKDKFIIVFEKKYLENIIAKRFSILDEVREVEAGNKIPVTISIGVSTLLRNLNETEQNAFSALELALARGGDQAVLKQDGNIEFFGGRTKAIEKRTKVKSRVIAHALRALFSESDKVYIMGHRFPDMDSFGAAIGVYRAAINRGKEAYIIIDDATIAIDTIYPYFVQNPQYNFLSPEKASGIIKSNDLLIIVDTQRPSYTSCPDCIKIVDKIVVFDHHRRGTEFIENYSMGYLEPYASSTSELVTEVLQYMDDKIFIEQREAEALLAGIIVDTKSFSFKTGVRTFEAASLLRRFGADTLNVKRLFEDDFDTFIKRSQVISNAGIYREDIAISVLDEILPNSHIIAAQSADELLDIKGVKTSFVLGRKNENDVFISGRSLGETNVQIILERLGGGGHMTTAGAQFINTSIYEARRMLIKAIDEYFEQE